MTETSLPPKTTEQENLVTARQSRINLIWEITQSLISILVTAAIIYCVINKIENKEISYAFFLIIGFYFSRTNHAAIGGIGSKPSQIYEGR